MIHIIEGLSGYGKTSYIWQDIFKKFSENLSKNKKILILVPEQFSFESEKMLCELQKNNRTTNIEVVNFKRLSNIILKKYGGLTRPTLTQVKDNIIINIVLSELKNELRIYKRQINNESFSKDILLLFNILKNNNISFDDIVCLKEKINNKLLLAKLEDICLIYKNYKNKINQKYIDNNDIINLAYQKLNKSEFFKDYIIYIDGFSSFTISEYNILEKIISQSEDCYLSLCLTKNINQNSILSSVIKTKKIFLDLAKKNNIKLAPIIYLDKPRRFNNQSLILLEKKIYNILNSEKTKNNFDFNFDWSTQADFNIFECQNINQEINFVAAEISNLIKNKNFRFNQISIITRDINLYRSYLDYIFKLYEIPYFLDERKKISDQRLIVLVTSSLEAVNLNFNTLSILKLLKTGFFGFCLNIEETIISKLEIYCDIWNINHELWLEDFKFNPAGFSENFSEEDKSLLSEINNIRKKIIDILLSLKEKLNKKNTGKEFVKTIYQYLVDLKIDQTLKNIIENNKQDVIFVQENIKIWEGFIEILDDITDIVGEKFISLKEFINIFNISVLNFDIGSVPQTLDQVTVAQADHLITSKAKVVFVIGLNQGSFPRVEQQFSIFSSFENKNLLDLGFDLYNNYSDKFQMSLNERYYVYKSITCASDKVYLSYSNFSIDSKKLNKSFFINQIKSLFKNLKIKKINETDIIFLQNKKTAYNYFCKNFNKDSQELISVREYLKNDLDYKNKIYKLERLNNINNLNKKNNFNINNKTLLKNFLKNKLTLSPSSIERFHICSFKFFLNDILKIRYFKKVDFSNLEQGVIIHYLLKKILEKQSDLDMSNIKHDISNLIKIYTDKTMGKHIISNNKNNYMFKNLIEDISRLICYITDEQSCSSFKAKEFELEISEKSKIKPLYIKLKTGEKILVSGKVDRVDFCNINNKNYIRVIDYKSGNKDFCLNDVYFGLNMQMLLYLFIIIDFYYKKNKILLPAGVLYLSTKEKILFSERNSDKNLDNNLESKIKTNFKTNGILIDDIDILSLMEKDLIKNLKSNYLPIKLNKDLSLSKTSSVLSSVNFKSLENYIKNLLISMAKSVFDGNFLAKPIECNRYKNVCDYCEYKSVCNLGEDKIFKIIDFPPENWI